MSDLRRRLHDRLEVLRHELQMGEDRLRTLERETVSVQQTVLRISGAIQVIEELLASDEAAMTRHTMSPRPIVTARDPASARTEGGGS